jgi:hypothetical protein
MMDLVYTMLLVIAGFKVTGIGEIDSMGAIVIAKFSFREKNLLKMHMDKFSTAEFLKVHNNHNNYYPET